MPEYINYLQTGSGSDHISIRVDAPSVEISIRSRWMGSDLKQYRLVCEQHILSECFGLFVVGQVHVSEGDEGSFEFLELEEEEIPLPFVIEYVRVPESPVYVHEGSQLVDMRPLGYATWNDFFELVLIIHDFEGRATNPPLSEICDLLDKKKFIARTEETEARRVLQEETDSKTSLQNWSRILGSE